MVAMVLVGKKRYLVRTFLLALFAVVAAAMPAAAAELKYTMHVEAKPAAVVPTDPMSAMAGGMISEMFPPGGLDQLVLAGERGVRSVQQQEFGGTKAGTIALIKPDGTQYIIDPSTKTYVKQPPVPEEVTAMMAQMKPRVTVGERGQFETINGMKCERLIMNVAMAIPGVDPSQLPPGVPTEITMTYTMWLTDAVKMPTPAASLSTAMLKQFGFDQMPELKKLTGDGRMMLKGVMSMFGVEMIMTSTGISTEDAPADLFEIPADYKEVPAIR
jgi:hypothetical protein